jgi:hypothetical protein
MDVKNESDKLRDVLKHPFLRIKHIAHPFIGGSTINSSEVMMHKKLKKGESFNEKQIRSLKGVLRTFANDILNIVGKEDV